MENNDLFFFYKNCKNKSEDEILDKKYTIAHSKKKYNRGKYIAYQGDRISYLYILTKGKVKTQMVSKTGEVISMEKISAPYPLAAAFLFASNNYFPVDIIALEDCEIILIERESVEDKISNCKEFMRGFLTFNADRIQYLSERIKIFAYKGIKAKFAYYVMSKYDGEYFYLGRNITSLAEYFGVERPSLSRVISKMVEKNIITFNAGKGKIIKHQILHSYLE